MLNHVKGILKVKLKNHSLSALGPRVMENLMQAKNTIQNKSTLYERRLKRTNDAMGDRRQPSSQALSRDLREVVN